MRLHTRTVMVSDAATSPVLADLVADVVHRHGGTLSEPRIGRSEAWFDSATQAVHAVVAIHQAIDRLGPTAEHPDPPRSGLHAGDVASERTRTRDQGDPDRPRLARDPDIVAAVAERLRGMAAPGQIFVSDLVRTIAWPPEDTADGMAPIVSAAAPMDAWVVDWRRIPDEAPITVVVAEDVAIVRAGIVALLREEGFDVVAEATDRDGLLTAARTHRPVLVITDVRMPPGQSDEGITAAAEIRDEQPGVAVLVLSQHVEPAAAALLLLGDPSGVGYLLKERVSHIDEFIAACRDVAHGGVVIDPLVTARLLRGGDAALHRLTAREREVLDLMAQGRSNAAIAREILCSTKTLEGHIRSIFTKLDLPEDPDDHRRVAAVVRYLHGKG